MIEWVYLCCWMCIFRVGSKMPNCWVKNKCMFYSVLSHFPPQELYWLIFSLALYEIVHFLIIFLAECDVILLLLWEMLTEYCFYLHFFNDEWVRTFFHVCRPFLHLFHLSVFRVLLCNISWPQIILLPQLSLVWGYRCVPWLPIFLLRFCCTALWCCKYCSDSLPVWKLFCDLSDVCYFWSFKFLNTFMYQIYFYACGFSVAFRSPLCTSRLKRKSPLS